MTAADDAVRGATRPRVRLVVLNYNGGEMTLRCLDHLEALDWPPDRLELVLVDNASSDGVVDAVRTGHPRVRVVETGANLGFPGNNVALTDLDGVDYVGLVNNDAFAPSSWLGPLVEALEADPAVGAACSKILFEPRFRTVHLDVPTFSPGGADPRRLGVQVLGVRVDEEDRWSSAQAVGGCHPLEPGPDGLFHWTGASAEIRVPVTDTRPDPRVEIRLRSPRGPVEVRAAIDDTGDRRRFTVGREAAWHRVPLTGAPFDVVNNAGSIVLADGHGGDRGFLQPDDGQWDEPDDVFAWCGASVLLRPRYLADVGVFADRFFLYYEDTDLSWRGRAAGWRHRYVPASCIRHLHSATSEEGSDLFVHYVERNRLLMLVRNAPASMALRQVLLHLRATASYFRRDVLGQVVKRRRPSTVTVRRRLRSELAFLGLLPWALRTRRTIRRRQVVPDDVLLRELQR